MMDEVPPNGGDADGCKPEQDGANDTIELRRRTLARLGIYGAATAPILLGLLKSEKANAASPIGPAIPGGPSVF